MNLEGGDKDLKAEKKDNKQLLICMAYNKTYNYFSIAFFALLQSKTKETYQTLHTNIKLLRDFKPRFITVDFESAHLEVKLNLNQKSKNLYIRC